MNKKRSVLPQIKKDIKNFLLSEEGKISKENVAKIGMSLTMLGVMLGASEAVAFHNSSFFDTAGDRGGHSSHGAHGAHASHGSHGSHTAHGSHASHGSHGAHGSHASHASHGSHGSHGNHGSGGWC